MKTQVLKMTHPVQITVIYDDSRDEQTRYAVYKHSYEQNEFGVYTKRKRLLDRVPSMTMALAWCSDLTAEKVAEENRYKRMIAEFERMSH